jgi:hypothetical protein
MKGNIRTRGHDYPANQKISNNISLRFNPQNMFFSETQTRKRHKDTKGVKHKTSQRVI